ncbi:MAG: methylthioribulose 1-phosphate dehydratase [Halothiobacillaceae bacterium]|jgi:methylthioribulose-1-phosphate dehydratase|nr:MAG: methylthioribulose 1-phosphate dehydratase [Halothiobacillaceae bacterium]
MMQTELANALVEAGRFFFSRGWVPATSSNFSARLDDERALLTVSGRHKGRLSSDDFLRVSIESGFSLEVGRRPSAETLLHTQLYAREPAIGCVLHTHSMPATVLSRLTEGALALEGYELAKAFPGVSTHESTLTIPVFANDQDIPRLAAEVDAWINRHGMPVGYLIEGHGLYTWGATVDDTVRHVEALEFMLECELWLRRVG